MCLLPLPETQHLRSFAEDDDVQEGPSTNVSRPPFVSRYIDTEAAEGNRDETDESREDENLRAVNRNRIRVRPYSLRLSPVCGEDTHGTVTVWHRTRGVTVPYTVYGQR